MMHIRMMDPYFRYSYDETRIALRRYHVDVPTEEKQAHLEDRLVEKAQKQGSSKARMTDRALEGRRARQEALERFKQAKSRMVSKF